ncbi:MAG: hypothetical protein A2X40_00105 [Elusimicrobia bacterium GWC2_65_9]|nr:MAG: hypothetical protein A2X40_00105 [Elusimicrobia bacterium GWC2_65_9]
MLGLGHVRDVGLRQREVAGGDAVDEPREEDQRQGARPAENKEAREGAELADDQQRPAAVAVGELAQDGPGDQLA